MILISQNVHIDKLCDVAGKCHNTYHRIVKLKPIDVKKSKYIDFDVQHNDKHLKFKAGDHVKMSKYKNSFAEANKPHWSKEAFVIKKLQNTVSWTNVIEDLNGKEIAGMFHQI